MKVAAEVDRVDQVVMDSQADRVTAARRSDACQNQTVVGNTKHRDITGACIYGQQVSAIRTDDESALALQRVIGSAFAAASCWEAAYQTQLAIGQAVVHSDLVVVGVVGGQK